MADRPRLAVALLAAGRSSRFGSSDKLAANFRGGLLGHHAALALSPLGADVAWVITATEAHPCAEGWRELGFEIAVNPQAKDGMGTTVAMAASLAQAAAADALLIALADMPLVPTSHFRHLAESALHADANALFVSALGDRRLPPACFGRARFDQLARSRGDQGARKMVSEGIVQPCPQEWLADIDDTATLARLS
ncbi:NTP transferase domain-containing protein [Altererythrobacter sp.]|nr:NTP transferase domain-containing protein [Altererythrobacter sp.]